MTLPYREWSQFDLVTLLRSSDDNSDNDVGDWTTEHLLFADGHAGKMGSLTPEANIYQAFHPIFKPKDSSFELVASMDQVVDFGFWYMASSFDNSRGQTSGNMAPQVLDDVNQADYDFVNGKYYDGIVGHDWSAYPPGTGHNYFDVQAQVIANLPSSDVCWVEAINGGTARGNAEQAMFFKNGVYLHMVNWDPHGEPFPVGDACLFWIDIQKVRVNYLNAVVNSLSRRTMPVGGGVALVLTGLGFDQDDAELGDPDRFSNNNPGRNWASLVDFIDFIGQQGQGTIILTGGGVDFTVDSDTQITIPSMPVLAEGTYIIRLRKENVLIAAPSEVYSYAGDWIATADGRVRESVRFSFLVGEAEDVETPIGPIFYTRWRFKAKDGSTIFQYWAPIDIRTTDYFYDGRLISESGITRSIDDHSGLPNISDMSVDVAVDKELRQLLAGYMIKNQLVDLYFGWANQPEAWKQNVITMIVDDYDLEGDVLKVTLKDITQKYFRIAVPRYIITIDEYPDAHESAIGQPMPEALGFCSKTDDPPGAINALYVNTTTFTYLALRGSARSILQVYSNGLIQVEGVGNAYVISYGDGGRTYINFNADQGDNKITFNCEGYMFAAWNSVNGYVQNPAYILGFLFAFLAEIPADFLDLDAIDALAAIFEARAGGEICGSSGECEWAGYLIIQAFQPMETVVQELNFTYGVKVWPDREGRFTFGIKDLTNWRSGIWVFEQIDALKPSVRKEGLREMMNFVKALYGNIPTASVYSGSIEESRPGLIVDYEAQIEAADSPWKFPWTNSLDLVSQRVLDELYKRGNGIKEISFPLAIDWIFELDIFDSFIYQNPFAPTLSGDGQQQWYYYVKSLSYNFVDNTINVIAVDLQWLLRQCMIIGVCADLAESWMDATEQMRVFGYVCECELSGIGAGFPDGEPCKKICPC